jgi:hypothetical protein
MTVNDEFKYDVAFSFLAEDESTATQINDLLQRRFRTFLYTQRQAEMAGADGELLLSSVFSQESRTIAVLYRPEWGTKSWTRIEETAIRNRAHDQGYDFTTFIAMTEPVSRPQWLPRNRLLYGLKRFGISGAAAALDAKIQDLGGTGAEESALDRAMRLKRLMALKEEQERFQRSEAGVSAATGAYERLLSDLKAQIDALSSLIGLKISSRHGCTFVRGGIIVLALRWEVCYSNSLSGAVLHVDFFNGMPRQNDTPAVERNQFTFQLVEIERPAWVESNGHDHRIEDLADFILKRFMDHEEKQQRRQQKET